MRNREYGDYLSDILNSIKDIDSFIKGLSFDSFKNDKRTVYATVRCIEVIGEAARKIPKSLKDKYPAIPWTKMVDMRNKVIHEYFGVDTSILWETVKEDIPSIKPLIQSIIQDLK